MALPKLNLSKLKGAVETGAKAAQQSIANMDAQAIGKTIEASIQAAQKGIENVNVDDIARNAKTFAESSKTKVSEMLSKSPDNAPEESTTFKEFISLLWYLANVDGNISPEEEAKINQLALSLDETCPEYFADTISECTAKLEESSREFGMQNAAKIEAQKLIESMQLSRRDAKLLCWNLLAVANADDSTEAEIDFIRFASERANLDASAFEELRNYSDALMETEQVRRQLKTSNRSFAKIEPLVNELNQRERKIIEAAQALITDN